MYFAELNASQWLSSRTCRILNTPVVTFECYISQEVSQTSFFCHSLSPNTEEIKIQKDIFKFLLII